MKQEFISLYVDLIKRFLEKKISAKIFEGNFLDLFDENADSLDNETYDIIEYLFYKVSDYTNIKELLEKNSVFYINEDQLRESAAKTLQELRALKDA